jgi:hypothetical protein
MEWPKNYPSNCPLEGSIIPQSLEVYYLVECNPPSKNDFLSLQEKRPERSFNTDNEKCQSCGISVFTDIKGIELARNVSRGLRKKKTAKGILTPDLGKIKNTPSQNTGDTHHTFWYHINAEPWKIFKVI